MIRKAKKSDLDKIYQLCEQYQSDFRKLFFLEQELNNTYAILLVEEENNDIVSFVLAHDFEDNLDILFFIVDKNYQNKGLGSKLMDFFVNNYAINNKTITLEVAKDNINALKLYTKFYFKEIYVREGYYNGVDAIIMRRE